MDYWLQHLPPDDTRTLCVTADRVLGEAVERLTYTGALDDDVIHRRVRLRKERRDSGEEGRREPWHAWSEAVRSPARVRRPVRPSDDATIARSARDGPFASAIRGSTACDRRPLERG